MRHKTRYFGSNRGGEAFVQRDDQPFRPPASRQSSRFRGAGWAWGGLCDGTYALAFAILLDATDSFLIAAAFHIPFALEVLTQFPEGSSWTLKQESVEEWVSKFREDCEQAEDWRHDMLEDAREFYREAPPAEGKQ